MMQELAFIIKYWKSILRSLGESMSVEGLNKILDDLKPRQETLLVPQVLYRV